MNNRRKYNPIKLEVLAREKGIIIKLIIPYYLEQDNILERTIRIIIKKQKRFSTTNPSLISCDFIL
jgi:hypothetical protein